jgi:ribonucleotide monophosphatase NagD (HAD superfamily)
MKKHAQKAFTSPVKGFLIDIDGVLYVEKQPLRGAVEAIEYLQINHIPFMLVTNTTRRSRYSLLTNLQQLGFRLKVDQIFSAPYAAALWLKERKAKSISLFLRGDTYREFRDFHVTTNKPEYLVIGDIAEDLSYGYLNQAFRLVMGGTRQLIPGRWWRRWNMPPANAPPSLANPMRRFLIMLSGN